MSDPTIPTPETPERMAGAGDLTHAIARAIYALNPQQDQTVDLDGRPTGKPFDLTYEQVCEAGLEPVLLAEAKTFFDLVAETHGPLAPARPTEAGDYVTVPREPDMYQKLAGERALAESNLAVTDFMRAGIAYRAMVPAAPQSHPDRTPSAPPVPPGEDEGLLEAIARIISPSAFAEIKSRTDGEPTGGLKHQERQHNRDRALTKARAISDILSRSPLPEDEKLLTEAELQENAPNYWIIHTLAAHLRARSAELAELRAKMEGRS